MSTKLTTVNVRTLLDGRYSDNEVRGLNLVVRNEGNRRSYLHRYSYAGKQQELYLGPVADLTLVEARNIVREQKTLLHQGKNPAQVKITPKKPRTLRDDVMTLYVRMTSAAGPNERKETWGEKAGHDFLRSFENHIFPALGDKETHTLTTQQIAEALDHVWKTRNATGKVLCQRLGAVFDLAIARDTDHSRFPNRVNPADAKALRAFLDLGYAKPRQHMRAMKWQVIPGLYTALVEDGSIASKALRFLILTCAPRASEVIDMKWQEVHGNIWHVPAERMKGRVAREIPLSTEALAILDSLRPDVCPPGAYVFNGTGGWKKTADGGVKRDPISNRMGIHAMINLLRKLGITDHVHGFRSCFKSFILDHTAHVLDKDAVEVCLDHAIGNTVGEAYRDTNLIAHRRILADRWACYLTQVEYTGSYGAELPRFQKAA